MRNTIGHPRWGEFLKEVATQLKERQQIKFNLNRKDQNEDIEIKVYNIYQNKLGFLLVNVPDDKLNDFIQELKKNINLPFYYNEIPIYLDSYLGLAFHKKEDTGIDLLKNAYQAMNIAVKEKRKIKIYDKTLKAKNKENFQLLGEINNALAENQFELHYMPIVKLKTGEIMRVEALIRWHHPEDGFISPGRFIPHVEKTGLIDELSR